MLRLEYNFKNLGENLPGSGRAHVHVPERARREIKRGATVRLYDPLEPGHSAMGLVKEINSGSWVARVLVNTESETRDG